MSSIVKVDTIQENTSANGITVDGLNIKDSKLVTANSVIASNITADAIDATKIADNAISEEHLDVTAITGHTAETSIATDDTILIHDTSASALRKMTRANFVSGIGGNNSPSFRAEVASNQNVSDATATVIGFGTETFDNGSCYDGTNKFTVPSGEAGKYLVYSQCNLNPSDLDRAKNLSIYLYKNGSRWTISKTDFRDNNGSGGTIIIQDTMDLAVGDYIQIYAYIDTTTGTPFVIGTSNLKSVFSAYKLIE